MDKKEIEIIFIKAHKSKDHNSWMYISDYLWIHPITKIREFQFISIKAFEDNLVSIINNCIKNNFYGSNSNHFYLCIFSDRILLRLFRISNFYEPKQHKLLLIDKTFYIQDKNNHNSKFFLKKEGLNISLYTQPGVQIMAKNQYNNDFLFNFNEDKKSLYNALSLNSKLIITFKRKFGNIFNNGSKNLRLYVWLNSAVINILIFFTVFNQISQIINNLNNDDYNKKLKLLSYLYLFYSQIYEFLNPSNENSLLRKYNEIFEKIIKSNNKENINPFEYKTKKAKCLKSSKLKKDIVFKNNFLQELFTFTKNIRNNTYHIFTDRVKFQFPFLTDSDVLIDKTNNDKKWVLETIKFLKDIIVISFSSLWNYASKLTDEKLILDFSSLMSFFNN